MRKRPICRNRRYLCYMATFLLALLLGISVSGRAEKEEDRSADGSTRQIEEGSAEFSPEGGLLKLELIGYANAVESFIGLTVGEVSSKISAGEEFLLFVGRPTCEWCRKLAPSLQEVSESRGMTVFYLDSTDTETDSDLANFRNLYDIPTVPAVILFKADGSIIKLDIDPKSNNMNDEINSSFDELASSSSQVRNKSAFQHIRLITCHS